MITWKENVDIIMKTFEINQKELAQYLHISASTVSRAMTTGGKLTSKPEEIFNTIFDPNNKNSPAHKMDAKEGVLLNILKGIIENHFKDVQKTLADFDCWEITDYKSFVLKWLKQTGRVLTAEVYSNKEGLEPSAETPVEQMVRIFEKSISEYHIPTHIYNLPNYLSNECDESSLSTQDSDMKNFVKSIQDNVLEKFLGQQNEDVFIKIREFNRVLESYNGNFSYWHIMTMTMDYYEILGYSIIGGSVVHIPDDDIIGAIDRECTEMENNLRQNISEEKEDINHELRRLNNTRDIIVRHKQLCELFEEICPGKQLLVF